MMERLSELMRYQAKTIRENKCTTMSAEKSEDIADRLAYYEDMEEQGRLVVLPCKVGDTVYVDVRTLPYNYLHPADGCRDFARCEIVTIATTKNGIRLKLRALYPSRAGRRDYLRYAVSAIGKTVFLTRELAEEALNEQKKL